MQHVTITEEDNGKITTEVDDSVTWSGLPAPKNWYVAERRHDGLMWRRVYGSPLQVIESISVETDMKRWLHVSVSHAPKKNIPDYGELQLIRRLFIGEDRECYMVFPPASRYVNINPVLHLWACLDEPEGVLPQFEAMKVLNGKEQLSV